MRAGIRVHQLEDEACHKSGRELFVFHKAEGLMRCLVSGLLFADADMQCPEPGHSVLQEQEIGAAHLRGILMGTGRGRDGQTQGKKRHEQQACAYAFHGSLLRRWIGCLLGAS